MEPQDHELLDGIASPLLRDGQAARLRQNAPMEPTRTPHGTPEHRRALERLGPSSIYFHSVGPVGG
jgi:hypothetical protein